MAPALLVLVKNPIPGKTKTRLAADVGDPLALRMYHQLMTWTRDQALGLGETVTRYLYYSDEVLSGDDWPNDRFHKGVQDGGDLGDRMHAAFSAAFSAGHDRAVIIGSDCPGITTAYLETAFRQLADKDVVIGPALDGGYTLLGLRQPRPELFRDMTWSTDRVLAETLRRAEDAGLEVAQLAPLSDVDYVEDWLGYGWDLPT